MVTRTLRIHGFMTALVLVSIFSMTAPLPAVAQEVHTFNVSVTDPAMAIRAFGEQAAIEILASADDLMGKQLNPVSGELSTDKALNYLLAGTGLNHRYVADRAVALVADAPFVGAEQKPAPPDARPKPQADATDSTKVSSSQFRLAQVDRGAPSNPAAVKKQTDQAVRVEQGLEEIVVTATRRSEQTDKVPLSIFALNQATLIKSGVKSIDDIAALTPGIEYDNFARSGAGNLTNIAIRGVTSTVGASTTGIYIDDAAIQDRVTGSSSFGNPFPVTFDLDRVEVVRGPQGTLFGAGAEGGAVRFILSEPSLSTFSGRIVAEGGFTRYGAPSYEVGAAGGGPIAADTVGFRASIWHRTDGGYVDHVNPFTGAITDPNSNYTQSNAARFALRIAPTESLQITSSVYWQRVLNHDTGAYMEYLSNPNNGDYKNGRLLRQPADDSYYLDSLKIDANLGFADLVSATSYFDRHATTTIDSTSVFGALGQGLPLGPLGYGNPLGPAFPVSYGDASPQYGAIEQRSFAEEVRLTSLDPNARLTWIGGLYFSHSYQEDPATFYVPDIPAKQPVFFQDTISRDKQTAAFGQADLTIVNGLKLTAGIRVARLDYTNTSVADGFIAGNPAVPRYTTSGSEKPVTPRFGLSYQVDERNLYYVSAAKGYRLGGANAPQSFCSEPTPPSYASDHVWSYEIGAKNRLLDDRLQLSTSVFHIDWLNIQQAVYLGNCGGQYVANTGSAFSNGFDVGAQALLTSQLRATLSISYVDARFNQNITSNHVPIIVRGDATGSLPQVGSPWNVTAAAEYKFSLDGHDAYVRSEDIFHSKNPGPFTSQIPGGFSYQPELTANLSTNLVNLRAGVSWNSYDISLFANNIFNSQPHLSRNDDITGAHLYTDVTFRPTTIGLNVNVHF
jgi:iron complex outermembrane receptor protein